ncbi:hypothetical protein BUALT_Bualt14G0053000 [Buddleja alternifolia]|uniref:Uncharacterized protein n=1 Tax=Buddleja alternifolia TaxID=168488 RepID=A0AAV6WLP9_9LAMI|nr:hypothetical protein BUALT_Bualt14G0053000 [Buddleja alternifolia]
MTAVSAVAKRLDYLMLAEGAPARSEGDLRDGVLQLHSDLDRIEKFLSDTDATKHISEDFKKQVVQLSYEIEDAIESYAKSKWKPGAFRSSFWKCSAAMRLREAIQIFNRRMDELKHFVGAERVGTGESSSSNTTTSATNQRVDRDTIFVEMEEDKKILMQMLLHENPNLSVIAIIGMGGLGKTTLAQKLFNDSLSVQHFDCRSWANASSEFQARDILETILFSLCSGEISREKMADMETMQLIVQLYKVQKGKRYLVVLDDVWDIDAWDTIKIAFPNDRNGSRVVITTRRLDVARDIATFVHELCSLSEEKSWRLFNSKFGPDDLGMILTPEMTMIGREIVKLCEGHPLLITLVGGMLKGKTLGVWKEVLHNLPKDRGISSPLSILNLSYSYLPFHLKPCFLYLGHFQPYQDIPVEKLYLLWMAEGHISMTPLNNKPRMEVAEDYFNQLVDRSLVFMVEKNEQVTSARQRNQAYQLHDIIRDLSISKGNEEDFLGIIDFGHGNKISSKSRRVAIYLDKFKDKNEVLINIPEAKYIRSFLFFDTNDRRNTTWPREFSDLKEFQWTRVLDFNGLDVRVKKLPRGIEKLIYLRYLSFQRCYLQALPSSFSNFPFLETLDLRVRVSCIMTIPNILRKLSSLRHLYFPKSFRSDTKDKLNLDGLIKLEILENFHASICDARDLLQLQNLQVFTGIVDGNNMDLKITTSLMKRSNCLRKSSLVVKDFDCYSKQRIEIVEELLNCNGLHSLNIEGYLGKLPQHEAIGSNITELLFDGSEFNEDPMPIIGKLPNLDNLVLCNDAFVGKKMVCSESDFPRLTSLKLATLQSLGNGR